MIIASDEIATLPSVVRNDTFIFINITKDVSVFKHEKLIPVPKLTKPVT